MSINQWSNKKTLLHELEKMWQKGMLLQAYLDKESLFPLRLKFKSPNSKDLSNEFDTVRAWIAELQKLDKYRIVYQTQRHRVIGENSIPCEAWVDTFDAAIALLNKRQQVMDFTQLINDTRQRAPQLIRWIKQYSLKALDTATSWTRLIDFVLWREQHPRPEIYLRQVSLPGIDSKFIEQHRLILAQLLDLTLPASQINNDAIGVKQFAQRYGFASKPQRVRFRLLDPELALLPGNDHDISISANDFQALFKNHDSIHTTTQMGLIKQVFITENEINFLAFPPQKNSLVIFGSGYGFEALAQVGRLSQIDLFYWGDIDTHGFAILDQLRSKFPHVKSFLMDEQTLMDHRLFWGQESKPEYRVLQRLIANEQVLYQSLQANTHQTHLRLEQERIHFNYLVDALSDIVQSP